MYICLCFMNKCRYTCLVSMWPKCPRTICVLWSSLRNASLLKRCWEIRQSPRDYTPKAPSRLFSTKTLIIWLNLLEYWGTFSRKDAYAMQTQTTLLYTLNSYSMPFISSSLVLWNLFKRLPPWVGEVLHRAPALTDGRWPWISLSD